jgi:hypothetical protein
MTTAIDGNISISTDNESISYKNVKKLQSVQLNFYESLKFEYFDESESTYIEVEEDGFSEDYEDYYLEEEIDYIKVIGPRTKHERKIRSKQLRKQVYRQYHLDKYNEKQQKLSDLYNLDVPLEVVVDTAEHESLIEQFQQVHIDLKLVNRPSKFSTRKAKTSPDTENFLMDIRWKNQTTGYGQHIIMYPGKETKIEVLNLNTKFSQLILKVQEPERVMKVERTVYRHKLGKYITVTNKIKNNAEERYFLLGKDEGHLFVAQLTKKDNTVEQAHKSLFPYQLRTQKKSSYIRQGEWFFLSAKSGGVRPYRWGRETTDFGLKIGTGRAHVAEEFMTGNGRRGLIGFARGTITHPEHKTITLKHWHRIYVNNESRVNLQGLTWID